MPNVTKAVIPAAGLGTRLLPLTQYTPKELLPIGGKPMIQYAIETHLAAGITEFFIITSPEKSRLRDFISGDWPPPVFPFEKDLRFYDRLQRCRILFATQSRPVGVADAIGLSRDFVGDEPFACIMPDCVLFSELSHTQQALQAFHKHRMSVIGTVSVRSADLYRFGNVGLLRTEPMDGDAFLITSLSGKKSEPIRAEPGDIVHKGFGGGIYLPEYFDLIKIVREGVKGEVDDVPIHEILIRERKLMGILLSGVPFDTGNRFGLRAAVHYAGRPVLT